MNKSRLRSLLKEAEIQSRVHDHENVLKLQEVYVEQSCICFVSELMEMDMFSYLYKYRTAISEQ